ncbi:MAG: hypothetical protein ACREX9_17510 [Gammaproteobacteria bacterium]
MLGPGKYDALCTHVRETALAQAAIVIVLGGNNGSGFSVQTPNLQVLDKLPDLLETIAREIRAETKRP